MILSDKERQAPTTIKKAEPSHLSRYKFAQQYISKTDTILDAPCGSGYGSKVLSLKGNKVYGVDNHQGAIDHSKEFFSHNQNAFYTKNIEDMKDLFPDNTFDKVVSFEGIEHLHNPNYFLDEVKRTLKPQGLFIISTPRKPHGSPFHIKEYDLDEFKELLQDKFKILEIYGQLFTDFHNLATSNINPNVYRRFNFIAICSNEK